MPANPSNAIASAPSAATAASPVANAATTAAAPVANAATTAVAPAINAGSSEGGSLLTLLHEFYKSYKEIVGVAKTQLQFFNDKLTAIENKINEFFEHDFVQLLKSQIKSFKQTINGEMGRDGPSDPNLIETMKMNLQKTINSERATLQQQNVQSPDPNFQETIQKLDHAQHYNFDGIISFGH